MITKRLQFGKIEILPDGQIQLREDSIYEEDGKFITSTYHRRVLEPSDTHTETDPRLVEVIKVVWTKEVIDEFKKAKEARIKEFEASLGIKRDE